MADRKSPERKKESAAINPSDSRSSIQRTSPPTKSRDRTPTEDKQRINSLTRELDQIEVRREKYTIEELEKRLALNKLRGVPNDTPINHTSPGSVYEGIEGHDEAFNDYVQTAMNLEIFEAKVELATEQLQRLREATRLDQADGVEADPK